MSGREIHGVSGSSSPAAVSHLCFAVTGADLRLREASPSFRKLVGECPVGTRLDEVLPVFAGVEATLDGIMKEKQPYWFLKNVAHSRADEGYLQALDILVLPNRSKDGLFVTILDVTGEAMNERLAVQERNEARLRARR
jgi:hypothetical protein